MAPLLGVTIAGVSIAAVGALVVAAAAVAIIFVAWLIQKIVQWIKSINNNYVGYFPSGLLTDGVYVFGADGVAHFIPLAEFYFVMMWIRLMESLITETGGGGGGGGGGPDGGGGTGGGGGTQEEQPTDTEKPNPEEPTKPNPGGGGPEDGIIEPEEEPYFPELDLPDLEPEEEKELTIVNPDAPKEEKGPEEKETPTGPPPIQLAPSDHSTDTLIIKVGPPLPEIVKRPPSEPSVILPIDPDKVPPVKIIIPPSYEQYLEEQKKEDEQWLKDHDGATNSVKLPVIKK
jgi:hypothetical protein